MRLISSAAIALLSICSMQAAVATPTLQTFAADGATGTAECTYGAELPPYCSLVNKITYSGVTTSTPSSAYSSVSDARGVAFASAALNPSSYLPTLRTYAASNGGFAGPAGTPFGGAAIADANIWAVQGYRYVGQEDFVLELTATLDSLIFGADVVDANHSAFRMAIFDTEGYEFSYAGTYFTAENDAMCPIMTPSKTGGCASAPATLARATAQLTETGSLSRTISTVLKPGQTFYVGAFLDAYACCSSVVNSTNSLNMMFNDASMLESFSVAGSLAVVPEPGSLFLLGVGLGMVALHRRRFGLQRD
jgi:hypothetical protein